MRNGKSKGLKRKVSVLVVVAMVCIVLIMGVYGSEGGFSSINPFGGDSYTGGGTQPTSTPIIGGSGGSTPTPIPSPTPLPTASPSPLPSSYPSPTPSAVPSYVMHLYVESQPKYGDYFVSIMVIGDPDDTATVWLQLEGESGAYLLFTEVLDEYGVYMTDVDIGEWGSWILWATSEGGGLSDYAYVVFDEPAF